MKQLTYSITINKPREFVFNKIMDKAVYPEWAKAWGEGMTYEGVWKQGEHIFFFDKSQGGTKVRIEELQPNEVIKATHVAMVNPENMEVELSDDMMRKWVGSKEEYYFKDAGEGATLVTVCIETDEAFEKMMSAWTQALEYFKEICER